MSFQIFEMRAGPSAAASGPKHPLMAMLAIVERHDAIVKHVPRVNMQSWLRPVRVQNKRHGPRVRLAICYTVTPPKTFQPSCASNSGV